MVEVADKIEPQPNYRPARSLEDHEMWLRQQLHELHLEYRDRAKPLVDALVGLEGLKPPRPIFLPVGEVPEQVLALIRDAKVEVADITGFEE